MIKAFYFVVVCVAASYLASCISEVKEEPVVEEKINDFELLNYAFTQGSIYDNREDSIELHFNKPILIVEQILFVKGSSCNPHFFFRVFNNGKSMRIPIVCVRLIESIEIEVEVTDYDFNSLTVNIPISNYKDKNEYEGIFRGLVVEKDADFFWLLTENPNRMYKIDHQTRQINQHKELDFTPRSLHQSPYDGLVYVTGVDLPAIFIYDPDDLTLLQEIPVLPEEPPYDHPQFPAIIPVDIAITRSGIGMVIFESIHSSGTKIRIIDAGKNHEIRNFAQNDPQEAHEDGYDNLAGELKLTPNSDKIIIIPFSYIVNPWSVFDPEDEFATEFFLPEGIGASYKKVVHQKTGWFYYYYNEDHYLWDWNRFMKIPVEREIVGLQSADFSYKEGENSTLYFLFANRLEKINLETGDRKAASIWANGIYFKTIPQTGDLLFVSTNDCEANNTGACTTLIWLAGDYFDIF